MIKFLLLLGVSGVGKSTLIRELIGLDARFTYISPFITRPLREGETDKIYVSVEYLQEMVARGEILTVNDLYGVRYATPLKPIENAFANGQFPLLDWPIKKLAVMEEAFPCRLCRVYLEPPTISELRQRLGRDDRDAGGGRLMAAIAELEQIWSGNMEKHFDIRVIATDGQTRKVAETVYKYYLSAIS